MQKLNISIVLYQNRLEQIKNVIENVMQSKVPFKLYLIDNSPNDKLKILENIDQKIEYIHVNDNIGYGRAHNLALRISIKNEIDYHLVLNPDIILPADALEKLVLYMEQNDDVGNVMPKILYPDGEVQYLCKLLPTPGDLILRRFNPFNSYSNKKNEKYELHFTGYKDQMNIPNLSGCFMFLRTDVIKEIGLFDENIFMYLEDVDLNRRIHVKYRTIFNPNVEVVHEYQKGSYKNIHLLKAHIRSAIYYFNKWGWFIDKKRSVINKQTLAKLNINTNERNNFSRG